MKALVVSYGLVAERLQKAWHRVGARVAAFNALDRLPLIHTLVDQGVHKFHDLVVFCWEKTDSKSEL